MNRFDYESADYRYGFKIIDRRDPDFYAFAQTRHIAEKIVKALNDVEAAKAEVARMCATARDAA